MSTLSKTISDPAVLEMQKAQVALDAAKGSGLSSTWTHSSVEFLAIAILTVVVLTLLMAAVLMWRHRSSSSQILRTFGVIMIVGFATLLLVIGYSSEQLTPIIGLFGAVAGYLLGKDASTPAKLGESET